MKYLTLELVLRLHGRMISQFGGTPQVRDLGLVESAVARPRARFGGVDLYPSLEHKAAVLGFSLCKNHGFADGNKRAAASAVGMFLLRNGHELDAPLDIQEQIFLRLAASEMSEAEFVLWLRSHIIRRRR